MGLVPRFSKADIQKLFKQRIAAYDRIMIRQLQILGEKCINLARTLDTYKDQTGNLRSSIGYILYAGGKLVEQKFEGNQEGQIRGMQIAKKHATQYISSNYYALIVVAGMPYAEAVETLGYAVLTPSEHLAEREFPRLMTKILDKIDKAA